MSNGSSCAVLAPQVGQLGAAGVVRVLDERAGLLDAAGAQVDGLHDLDVGLPRPVDELVQPERVGLDRVPGAVERGAGARSTGPTPSSHAVAGDEVAAGVADHRGAELLGQVEDVLAEAVLVGRRVARLVDAGVDAPAHVLDEGPEDPAGDGPDGEVAVERDGVRPGCS